MPTTNRPIRVCMFPKSIPSNESLGLMSTALERTGLVTISNFNYFTSFFSRSDLFHIHWVDELVVGARWPKHIVKVSLFLIYLIFSKILKRPIVWTVHNIGAQESNYPRLERFLWNVFLPRVDWAIHLCSASLEAIFRLTPTPPPGSVVPHPHYRAVYGSCGVTADSQARSSKPFVFSSFGLIRTYKGFENLVEIFHSWALQEAVLKIAGAPVFKESTQMVKDMHRLSGGDPRINLDLRALEIGELKDFVCASDLIVLPYHKIMNSGVAALALSLGRPILGPAAGCILDYQQKLGAEWVLTYEKMLTLEDLKKAYNEMRGRKHSALPDLEWMDPDRIAAEIIKLYQRVLAGVEKAK
jgi:glycosyltransferase involved in cell wall biosynthesis